MAKKDFINQKYELQTIKGTRAKCITTRGHHPKEVGTPRQSYATLTWESKMVDKQSTKTKRKN